VLLIWVYYSAQIFLLGAEFTWVYANERMEREDARVEQRAMPPSQLEPAGLNRPEGLASRRRS